jgi:hypothetical protein
MNLLFLDGNKLVNSQKNLKNMEKTAFWKPSDLYYFSLQAFFLGQFYLKKCVSSKFMSGKKKNSRSMGSRGEESKIPYFGR